MTDEWLKALVLVLRKLGVVEILVTQADMDAVNAIAEEDNRPTAICFQQEDGIHVRLVTNAEKRELEVTGATRQ